MRANKNHRAIIDYIRDQIGIDVAPHATPRRLRAINVDVHSMPPRVETAIRALGNAYRRIYVLDNGGLGIAVFLRAPE